MNSQSTIDSTAINHGASCPCKRLMLSLSSFTAAEYGDVNALVSRAGRSGGSIASFVTCQDSAGNTPLHLAAQHGHAGVVSLLLNGNNESRVVNAAAGGATPLHRACFSGAVSTIRLLLEHPVCDLLARDTSFGDLQTPLHKSASGGRYLAVQLLLQVLQLRSASSDCARPTVLETALSMLDSSGRTPLQVARDKQRDQDEERRSVVKWDIVAGGAANWETCIQVRPLNVTTTNTPILRHCTLTFQCCDPNIGQMVLAARTSAIERRGNRRTATNAGFRNHVAQAAWSTKTDDESSSLHGHQLRRGEWTLRDGYVGAIVSSSFADFC